MAESDGRWLEEEPNQQSDEGDDSNEDTTDKEGFCDEGSASNETEDKEGLSVEVNESDAEMNRRGSGPALEKWFIIGLVGKKRHMMHLQLSCTMRRAVLLPCVQDITFSSTVGADIQR